MSTKYVTHKVAKIAAYELPLRLERQETGGYVAFSPLWADCYAQGDTADEAIIEATAVAASLVELFREEGLPIPLRKRSEEKPPQKIRVPLYVSV